MNVTLKIKKIAPEAIIPKYAKPGDAGLDLVAIDNGKYNLLMGFDEETGTNTEAEFIEYRTGVAVEIPEGYVGLIYPRSSISNFGLSLSNAVGVIDSGYRGEIKFRFRIISAPGTLAIKYKKGDKIGQLIVMPYPKVNVVEVDELSTSERGEGGFGSSGK